MSLYLYSIVLGTLITGAANSLFTKYQDNQCVLNCDSPDLSKHRNFEQPGIQTLQMFIGELSMFFVFQFYKWYKNRQEYISLRTEEDDIKEVSIFSSVKLAIPALCDLTCTTLLNIGLVYTPVSIYQMTRGSVVLFVAILSVIFLHRKITKLEWISLFFVSLGVAIVGLSGSKNSSKSESLDNTGLVVVGIFLIVFATLLQGVQFVVEEHILEKQPIIPLQLVFIEGFYGASILLILMILLNFIIGSVESKKDFKYSPFNLNEAFSQVFNNEKVLFSSIMIMISIATFNYCGLSITHKISATARSTIDTCRTLLVWIVAIIMGWESFHLLQFFGFIVLVFGTLCFNGVLKPETWSFIPSSLKSEFNGEERLINVIDEIDEPIDRIVVPSDQKQNSVNSIKFNDASSHTPSLQDTLRSEEGPLNISSKINNQHPLESRINNWEANEYDNKLEMYRRVFGSGEPIKRTMDLKIIEEVDQYKPSLLSNGNSLHKDVLLNKDTSIDWDDIYTGGFANGDNVKDFHSEMEKRLNI
ncbi:unnamed protein product [Candida verbasci]|uniref:Uncharacterized protein n=1 Tax=Candida verbasci TaxID=1227364 RepID=A0A9W4XEB2_9ASCO|nr:unnamed protein product [Candida verbasci]